jgi:hypothetical protein
MTYGILLSVFNRVDDLLAHLDILSFSPFKILIAYLKKDIPEEHIKEINKHPNLLVYSPGFYLGPPLSLIYGIRKAKELGIDTLLYRNADDWLFDHNFTQMNFDLMNKYKFIGYNWFGQNNYNEFAMNEMYINVEKFYKTSLEAEQMFLASSQKSMCEFKMPQWIINSIGSWDKFYRLKERETELGIGYNWESIAYYHQIIRQPIPDDLWKKYDTNNRFFNEKWQLIGSHSNQQRLHYWSRIKNKVPYAEELEKMPNFSKWLDCANNNRAWNLPNSSDHIENKSKMQGYKKRLPIKLFLP